MATTKQNKAKKALAVATEAIPPPIITETAENDIDAEMLACMERMRFLSSQKAQKTANAEIERHRADAVIVIEKEQSILIAKKEEYLNAISILEIQISNLNEKKISIQKGEKDADLTKVIAEKAGDLVIIQKSDKVEKTEKKEPNGDKRVRAKIIRRPLSELIKSKTEFRFIFKGGDNRCFTEDGATFDTEFGKTKTLAEWAKKVLEKAGEKGTEVSVFKKVDIFMKKEQDWRRMEAIHNESCESIN